MGVFPDAWLGELLSKSDIVSIASEYTMLKPKGRRLWGCCPFHSEKTPSFSVTPDNQLYYCFGCHAGGSIVQFVMEAEKLSYVEAVKYLAQRAGMELPEELDSDSLRRERELKERMYAACREAALYYHDMLMGEEGKEARAYLIRRGIDGATVKKFGLGYAPGGWEALTEHLGKKGYSQEELIAAGLAVRARDKNRCYDAYRNRVIFPIVSTTKRVIGFGARTMGEDTPKYLNTGDTLIFNKRNNLYALNLQKGKHLSDIIIVEGYMDVISLYKGGVDNAVASLGTALTQQQARLIKRYAPRVYICYDGDAAGQNATLRGMEILAREGLEVKVMVIPGGADPDDYIRQHGREEYLTLKDKALSLTGFKLDTLMAGVDMDTPDGREAYAKRACAYLGALQPVEQERYSDIVSRRTGLSKEAILRQCGLGGRVEGNSIGNNRNTKQKSREAGPQRNRTETELLGCMLKSDQALLSAMEEMAEYGVSFSEPGLNELAERLLADYATGSREDIKLMLCEATPAVAESVSAAMERGESILDPEATAKGCVAALARELLDGRINELSLRLSQGAGEAEKQEYMKLVQKRASLR